MNVEKDTWDRLREYIKESENIVFFGGAGVSTESGIKDFRSKDGLYNQHDVQFEKYQPEYLLSHSCLYHEPKVFFEYYRQKMNCEGVLPNVTHKTLVKLEDMGKLSAVVTQNIDGLHQMAGSRKVFELHGTTHKNYCVKCGRRVDENFIYDSKDPVPLCPDCGGMIRPEVVLYEEGLPDDAVYGALEAIGNADMLIVAGTSLTVYPAAGFVHKFRGKHIVVINRDRLDLQLDESTDLAFYCSMGEVFRKIEEWIENKEL